MKQIRVSGQVLVNGPGSLDYIKTMDETRFFIVTGKGSMFKNGTIDKVTSLLKESGKTCEIYSGVGANPTVDQVLEGVEAMRHYLPDAVLAIGGGSAIDAAKSMTLLCEYENLTIDDMVKGDIPKQRHRITLIAAPSTSGTASEVTMASVITFPEINLKIGLKTPAFIPDVAILDGNLTLSMPKHVMVESGMDALTHGLESYINRNNDDFTKSFSKEAVIGLCRYLQDSYDKGDIESRQKVHNYQCLAGMGFTNSGLGMDHGIAHAFGGRFGTSHGLLNAVALPYVLKYNARDDQVREDLSQLSAEIGEDIIDLVERLNKHFGVPKSFKDMGLDEKDFKTYYEDLLDKSLQGSTKRNPVAMTREEMDKVLQSIYYGKIIF